MNSATCAPLMEDVGGSIAGSLSAVDCLSREMTTAAFSRLFGQEGGLLPALTILLTLFVAFFGFQLLTGRGRLSVSSLTPRMMTLGLVLAFATSWFAYQSVVWNLAIGAPEQLAGALLGGDGPATVVFAQKIDVAFLAVADAAGAQGEAPESIFSPSGLLWFGATLLLLGTVGILVTTRIALAVLLAAGPIFVVTALFNGTRGIFVGWLKGVVMLALAPLFAVVGGSMMLELSVPVLSALVSNPGDLDPRTAMAFFMIGAVHCALMVLVLRTAGTMVAGWSVFGLANPIEERTSSAVGGGAAVSPSPGSPRSITTIAAAPAQGALASAPATGAPRRIDIAGIAVPQAANDSAGNGSGAVREARVFATGPGERKTTGSATISRARGIGSRFKAAPRRSTEKL